MTVEEFGKGNEKTIVMLHGAYFVHTFSKQYPLAEKYRILVPHIMGYGSETSRVFDTDTCVNELAEYISSLGTKVLLVGFSLGAQIAIKLVAEHPELFSGVIAASPWLIKEEPLLSQILEGNRKQCAQLKKKAFCGFVGLVNGLPPAQRKEFTEQMQQLNPETVERSVDNGITLDSLGAFANVDVPVVAIAGAKEPQQVADSIRKLAEMNPNCRCEIWEKAAHNIPPVFAKRFNELIISMA